ncbi:dehydrogenase [Agromyces salentinus]|uniref:Dehydrogenase n=1 Tax=Agromyces salentinus TaxID=269421 RepID=A0ABN2MFW3_9MICO|nr:dehydrogenase [Agromyces salentinus]
MGDVTSAAPSGHADSAKRAATATHVHVANDCPECFVELQRDSDWWKAKPEGSRLVGLVVARDDMPPIVEQRRDLTAFGVAIPDFRFPAPENDDTWEERLERFFGTLRAGDVLVVANRHAMGRSVDEETRTIAALRRRGIVVKVLSHGARHLADAEPVA